MPGNCSNFIIVCKLQPDLKWDDADDMKLTSKPNKFQDWNKQHVIYFGCRKFIFLSLTCTKLYILHISSSLNPKNREQFEHLNFGSIYMNHLNRQEARLWSLVQLHRSTTSRRLSARASFAAWTQDLPEISTYKPWRKNPVVSANSDGFCKLAMQTCKGTHFPIVYSGYIYRTTNS